MDGPENLGRPDKNKTKTTKVDEPLIFLARPYMRYSGYSTVLAVFFRNFFKMTNSQNIGLFHRKIAYLGNIGKQTITSF